MSEEKTIEPGVNAESLREGLNGHLQDCVQLAVNNAVTNYEEAKRVPYIASLFLFYPDGHVEVTTSTPNERKKATAQEMLDHLCAALLQLSHKIEAMPDDPIESQQIPVDNTSATE